MLHKDVENKIFTSNLGIKKTVISKECNLSDLKCPAIDRGDNFLLLLLVFYRVHGQVSSDVACHLITERKVMLKHSCC